MKILQIAFSPEVTLERDGEVLRLGGAAAEIPTPTTEERELWQALEPPGTAWSALQEARRALAPARRAYVTMRLEDCLRRGVVETCLAVDGRPLATRRGMSARFHTLPVPAEGSLVLSRFACCRRGPRGLLLESPLCHARVLLHDERGAGLLARFAEGVPARGEGSEAQDALAHFLAETGLLVDPEAEEADPDLRMWEFHDLLFHARTRAGRHDDPYGKAFPWRGILERLPPLRPPLSDEILPLDKPDMDELLQSDAPFTRVMEERRSLREGRDKPLTLRELGEFLYRSCRLVHLENETAAGSRRPYASAGGLNELEMYVTAVNCEGLAPGLYHYDPRDHRLERLPVEPSRLQPLLRFGGAEPLGVHITMAARFPRVSWSYASIPYSLILKNVGCVMQTMNLVATAMGLAACAIGAGDSDAFADLAGLPYASEGSVGEFVLR